MPPEEKQTTAGGLLHPRLLAPFAAFQNQTKEIPMNIKAPAIIPNKLIEGAPTK